MAARLRQVRVIAGFTSQSAFAESLRGTWKQDHISRYETGATAPPGDFLRAIAEKHHINTHWILTGEGPIRAGDASAPEVRRGAPVVAGAVEIVPAEDMGQIRPEVRAEYVPLLGGTAAGPPSFETDRGQPVGWADEFVRVPGAMVGQFALRLRGQSMAPDYPDGSLLLVGGPVEPREGRETLALVFIDDAGGDSGHTVKCVSLRGPELVLRPLNPDYVEQVVPLGRIRRILGILKRLA